MTQNIVSKNYYSLFFETLLSVKVEHLFSDSYYIVQFLWLCHTTKMYDFQLSFSDDGESGGGGGDDDDYNNLFYINHRHLPHVPLYVYLHYPLVGFVALKWIGH